MDSTAAIAWIVSFVLVTVAVTGLSRRVGWSAPVALVAVGALRTNAAFLADALERPSVGEEPLPATYRRLRRLMLAAERGTVLTAQAERRYQEHAVRAALASIDAEETALQASAPKKPGAELT
jgi:hypothetical protein